MKRALLLAACAQTMFGAACARAQAASTMPVGGAPDSTQAGAPAGSASSSTSPSEDPSSAKDAQTGLGDIVVTAQRRSENLQRAALAVTAVAGDALLSAGVTRPTELTTLVPALQVAPSAGPYSLFYLRGVGNFNGNALSDPAVAFNFDGVYVGRPSGTTGFFYDLDRVEVVKGPQGTLYGRNATGGAINVISRRPDLNQLGANATVEYGNYNAVRADAAVNLPIGDKVALRVAGTRVSHDGYMKDGTDDQDDVGGRVSLRAEPLDSLSVSIVADYFRQRGLGVGGTIVEGGADNRYGLLSPQGQAIYASQPNLVLGRGFAPFTTKPFLHNDFWGISGTFDIRLPIGTVTIVPAYREAKLDYLTDTPGFYLRQREKDSQSSVEVRLASGNDHPIRYLVGGFAYREINDVPQFYINQQANVNLDRYRQVDENAAAFGRLTYAPFDALRFTVGGRYTTESKTLNGTLTGDLRVCTRPTSYFPAYVPGCPTAQPIPLTFDAVPPPQFVPGAAGTIDVPSFVDATGPNVKRNSYDRFTYRLGVDFDVSPRNLLYASYETGFKSGGFYLTVDAGVYRPEKIQAWTIGSKNRFLDNRLQINLEGFYWKYTDQQITHLIADSSGQVVFATENVGRARYYGAEAEGRFLLTRLTELNGDVQYLNARYDDFVYRTPNSNGGMGNGTSCPNNGTPGASYVVNCAGKVPPYAPRWTINLGLQQTVEIGESSLVGLVRAHHQTLTLTGLEFTTPEYQQGYWQLDAQLTYALPGKRFTIGGFVQNATNVTIKANSFPVPLGVFTASSLRPPRTFGARVSAKF